MKKATLTEDKAEKTPTGGVLVGKREGQTIIHNKGTLSGYLVGKTHAEGGIKAVNKSTGQPLEMQGGEVVITAPAVSDNTKREFEGKMMTNREILSTINEKGGGVAFAKDGMEIPKSIKHTGASYKYGGKTMKDHEILKHITGGHLAKGMTLPQIAKKHKVSLKELQKQVDMGMKAESEHTPSKREQMKIVKDHLFENPKYYTVLKKAGLKHGGRVHRDTLVRDSKRGNTPARDLNNYNDVLDIDADGVYGAETGLFGYGGAVAVSYARGGATDVTVNNWSDIPEEYKKIRLPKNIDWLPIPTNEGLIQIAKPFLSGDSLRPALQGMNFDDNGITFTNSHILLTIPIPTDVSYKGIYKKDGVKVEATYPKYENVIPQDKIIDKTFYIDVLKLLTYCKVAKNYSGNNEITFKVNNSPMSFNSDYIIDFLTSLIKLGGNAFWYVGYQSSKQALVFSKYESYQLGKDIIGLIMPYIYEKRTIYGTENKEKNAVLNVYFDFDDDVIRDADGIAVGLDVKPTKERAKRTPKTTSSKTSEPSGKFSSGEIDVFNQIDAIIETNNISQDDFKSTYNFIKTPRTKDYDLVNTLTGDVFTLRQFDMSLGYDSQDYNPQKVIALINDYKDWKASTPTKETKKIEDEVTIFKLLPLDKDFSVISGYSIYGGQELVEYLNLSHKNYPEILSFAFYPIDTAENELQTIYFQNKVWTLDELKTEIKRKAISGKYNWNEFLNYSIHSTSFQEDLFKKIDKIVEDEKITDVVTDAFYLDSKIKDFTIVNDETGEVFILRKYNNILGAGVELAGKKETQQLIKDYLEYKALTPTATKERTEQPKPSKTEKPKRNFELERKYLSQRISDLAKELDLKKPILSNEEVAFYQREINSFILKLRRLNDAEMSLKPIEERVRGVYDLQISSYDKQYEETEMTSINALKSQLTDDEYFTVRTPEFKSFFGDWETAYLNNSYAGVSKVINPVTKEPQPVFHGTNVLFVNWKTYETNNAHYFAVKREFSEFFATTWEERTDKAGVDSETLKKLNPNRGNFLLRCFLDVRNPIDFSRFGVDKYPIREYLTFLRVNYNIGDFDFWTNITSHSGITQDTEVYAWQIIRLWQSFTKYVKVFTTYDGYIFYEYIPTKTYGGLENASLSYCAFDSNQIKFTNAYEFNALSNDSRFDLGGIL